MTMQGAAIMLRLVLVLVLQCLLTNGQGPGPGPGSLGGGGGGGEDGELDKMSSRSVDTRVKFSVMEGNPANTFVGAIPLKPGFTYRFNEPPREFTLNGTSGEIHTTGILDREALVTDRFDLVVLSSQPTYPIEVRINVVDINDNSPRFPEPSIHVTFSESANAGTRVILDTATDGDAGDNDITTDYKIVDGNEDGKFKLQVTTHPSGETPYLHLETTGKLDRETRASYQLNISAQDGGSPPRYGFLLVNVSILDVNDNPPIFDHSDYIVSLNESVPPGTSVLQVQATDNDIGDNARLTYYLAESETQFSVDPETGIISTVEPLNCHQNCQQQQPCPKSCVFTVFARDHGSPLQDGRTYVTVNLLDANDHDPIVSFRYFPTTADFATVDENAQNGSVVAAVSVIDADEGPNGETTVEIRAGNELGHFRLDSKSSFDIVRVNGVLDREKISKYNVTIVATDKGTPPRSSTAFLIIHVNDINDHEPVFEKSEYSAVLSELVPIGTYVAGITANDEDTGVNSNIYYAIVSGNDNQWFDIDLYSGLITTKAPLDREVQDSIDLKISARDGGPNPKWAYTHLKVSILDENDEKPTFSQPWINVSLSENTPPDTLVTLVLAVDHDQGTNGSVSYMFDQDVEHTYPGIFALDVSSGRLSTKTKLDREEMPQYEIKVVAKDQGIPPLSSTATIVIDVQDVNDNSPEFYPQQYFVVVTEDLPLGSSVLRVSATDKDIGENAITKYEIIEGEENDNTFEIESDTGIIRLIGRLSHIRKAQYRLAVSARDIGDRKAVEDATVDIVVESNQIELLQFEEREGYKFSIVEDDGKKEALIGRQVGQVSVLNPASVGPVSYVIVAGDPDKVFSIDERTGFITTAKRIDREQASIYSLRTVATTTSAYGRTWVNVSIEDVNDNPPTFPVTRAYATVAENWPVGHQVFLARAFDTDDGINSQISYSLSNNPDDYFTISKTSGMIYLNKPVKYSKANNFRLEVAATDAGSPPQSSRQVVSITVEDVNDHTPIFEHGSYETSLLESTPVNDRFFALTASDEDDGMNGFVSYDITEGNGESKFGIFPDGFLYVRSALDREAQDYFALTIVARDHGTPPRSSTVSVVIHVIDENDNSPVFTNATFTFYLAENEPPDTYVGKLTAVDKDKGRNAELTYSIATNQKDFVVDPKSGFLKTLHYFDREDLVQISGVDYISMEAVVLDNGITRLKDKAKVNIYITDVNDNPPRFLRTPYRAQVLEGSPLNTQVIRISATDADEGLNGDVVYTIVEGNEEGRFKVDETTGQVTLARPLDRESTPRYLLTVAAADLGSQHGLTATATLTVDVLDENDNAPEFTLSESEISIVETTPVDTVLVQFQATDADLRMNKEVSFMIGGGNMQEAFRIDTKTGILYLERPLDFEEQSLYRLNITAADHGSPRLTSTISFVVHVQDYNDNPPSFPNTAIWRRIEEGIPPKSPIVTVTAEDPDSGVNGKIKYTIKSQEPPGMHFSIDENTGQVSTLKDIDREFSDTFRLTVVATDQAEPQSARLSAEKLVTVIVEDINDNAPHFVSMNAGILKEGSPAGTEIMRVSARDLDANTNGLVTYDLGAGNKDIFRLDRVTGALKLAKEVSSPDILYRVTVRATDEAVQSRRKSSEAYLTILTMSSQEGPKFSQNSYLGSVLESSGIGTSVATVTARVGGKATSDNIAYYVVNVTAADGRPMDRMFTVQQKGEVATAAVLDREDGPDNYIVTVAAMVTQTVTPMLSTTQVVVTVEDKNDSPPSFGEAPLRFTVSEDLLAGRQIATLRATDPDTLGTLTYSLVDGDDNKFTLDATTGDLSLHDTLDRETKSEYQLTVRADDGEQYTDTTIYIKVTDTNDNPPVFHEPAYSFDIPEDSHRGAKVGQVSAWDADEGTNGQVSYTVISDWGNDVFSLNPQTGVFTLTSRLDYEQVQHYILVVQAQDTGRPSLSSTVTVYFNVQDLNDNAPIFDPMSYSDEVFENITVGSSVLSVSATDQDSGVNGRLVYSISGGDEKDQFSISANGTIFTKAPLDREDQSFYNLVVRASDMAEPPLTALSSTVQVTIILRDVNDMAPQFVTPNETVVAENTPVNTVVMAVKAVDSDEGRNSYIEYSLALVPDNRFVLGPVDGLLRIAAPLDREDRANYSLVVTARDRGNPPNAHTLTISLRVADENDNSPIFDPKQYSASVPENTSIGISVLQVSATDADEGLNGRVRYTIVAGDKNRDFSISEDTGVIRVAKNLNYERRNDYLLTVQAEDSGADVRYDSATVTISITDINDNAPVFLDSPYLVYVMENMIALPAPIATVTAFDADNPPYNRVNYLVKEGDKSVFSVNATSGQISLLRALDREERDHYTLTVVAMDTGTPRLTGTGTISVLVQDENDHAPKFHKDEYEASVSETVAPQTQVIVVAATDNDAGDNAKISYSLVSGAEGLFVVEEWTGVIRTVAPLDRESVGSYSLLLQARDSSLTESRTATTQVTVTVRDENDNAPTFSQSQYIIHIPDPTAPGSFVFGGEARDPDEGVNGRVTYYLSGNDADKFYMNQETGVIKASTALAGESIYELEILATDSGDTPLSATAKLQVHLRPNNLFPVFEPLEKTFSFSEAVRGDLVTTLTATSPKAGPNGAVVYSIAGGNVGQAFLVDEKSGELRISQFGLDYETASRYEVWVAAQDKDDPPLTSVTHLVVNVTDYNDNAPVFSQAVYNASILEAQYPPQLVATVSATDRDSGMNAQVMYQLKRDSPAADAFTLDAETGQIYTKIKLDREEVEVYTLTVEAVDKGTPAQTGTAMVVVTVQDKNDNPPRFTRLFSVNVTENADIGTFVIQVTSSDRDIGENANATYSFTENPGGKFYIDPVSGNVTVARTIDRELNDEYLLKVSAVDGSWRAETPLTITVQDENDNAPEFDQSYYVFNFPELQRSVAFVGQLTATDRDKHGPNSVISYSLKFPSDFFSVNPSSGEILSKQALQYKHTLKGPSPENQYQLVVVATDNGKPPMSSESSVVINVVDANNNPPRFSQDHYFTPVPESSDIGKSIIQLKAIDNQDFGINAEVEYQKVGGNGTDYFILEPSTGWITVARKLSGLIDTQFILSVHALDHGVPPLQDEVEVILVVTGENQHTPEFAVLRYQFIVPENEPLGSTIGTLKAADNDEGPNGLVRYSITSGNEAGKFSIDENTGAVIITHLLDYDAIQEYRLNITAQDLAFVPRQSTAIMIVILTDINDNPPRFSEQQYDAYIAENANAGTTVFVLNATDIDSARNAVIQYTLVGGDGREYFTVNAETGVITSRRVFDYEEKSRYVLDVRAANYPDSSQWGSVEVIIHVTGRNEYFPRFIQPVFQFTVSESARIGTSVGAIQATDEDKGEDGHVYYLLVGASNDRGFLIQPTTGVITVARNLDRESQNRVVLTVMAKNAGSIRGNDTDEAQIIISIQDGNDPPVFSQPLYETRLSEGALVGTRVLTVTAVDSDVRLQNNQFTYSIIGGNLGQVFKVDPQSGVIETTAQLDRETIQVYNLTVGAIDNGSPPQTGTTLVRVILDDVNDNGPQFDPPDIVGYVPENEPAMTSVMTLSATDPDLSPNTQPFTYYIVGGEHREFFSIDQATGEVKTTRSIDRETTSELNFRIEVEDSGKPKMKSEYPVTIIVLDKNDSPSTPRTVTVKVQTFRGVFPGGKVADVHPNDADTSGQYSCQILTQDASIFSIPNACNLHAARVPHDRTYTLSVSGNDGRHPDVTSKVTLEFESFDNSTLDSSLTLRLLNVTADRFLRLYYKPFIDSLLPLFSGGDVRIYSMLDVDSHTDLTLTVARSGTSSFLPPAEVTRKLAAEEPRLTQSLQGLQLIVDYNPCSDTPCKNGGECSHGIHAYDETEITDSPSFIFTSPLIRHDVSCKCRQGFTGPRCELRQDPCSPNPCQYGGTCARKGFDFVCTCPPSRQGPQCEFDKTNACDDNPCRNGGSCQTTLEGGFFCLCRPGYRGNQCELASESCRPNPCLNGGSCISLKPGYRCSCKINFYGTHCEKSTFSFSELSYMTFPTLDSTTNDISITFSTNKPDALLVYNYGLQTGGRSDFVAIELKGGEPRFSFGGARTEITRISVGHQVADGKWYKVTATRNGRVISLSVASCTRNSETCGECRPGDSSCYSDDTGPTGTLNFNNEPMYLGGVMTVDPLQERPGQVLADDFIGCIQAVSINGRPLNLSGPIQARGISNTCERVADVCAGNPCGEGGTCLDRWSTHMCRCSNNLVAPDCEAALRPAAFTQGAFVEFLITEQHRRRQLLPRLYQQHSRWSREANSPTRTVMPARPRPTRQVPPKPPKSLSFKFRTWMPDGVLLHSATNNDYTLLEIRGNHLQYTSKMGANQPINMTIPEVTVNDGVWHNLTLLAAQSALTLLLDDQVVGDELDLPFVHDFLDAYLTSLTLGSAPRFSGQLPYTPTGFVGCMSTFSVDGEVQPLNSTGSLLEAVARGVSLLSDCTRADLGTPTSTDPLSIGITLVIVFFVLLLVAIMVSFIVYRVRRQRREKNGVHVKQNGSALLANTPSDSVRSPQDSGYVESAEMTDDVLRSHLSQELATKKYKERDHPQRPDIIEREVMNKSPGVPLRVEESQMQERDTMAGLGHMPDSEAPEHYDLENASSIAPSDIDIVYHYKGYRDGNVRKYKTNPHVSGYHKHNHRHSPHNFPNTPHRESPRNLMRQSPNPVAPRESPSVLKMQSTPLARLSPSSELSQQTPRILTLQDISGKPLQTALLATSQGPGVKDVMSTSERSLNSPVSHLSQSSGSMHASSQSTKKKKHDSSVSLGLTAEEIERLNTRPRNSSLVSTLDAVSSSSEDNQRKDKLAELLETNTELLEPPDSSTDESGNDSFTCSEFEYENNYEKVTRDFGPGNMIFSKLAEVDNENEHDNESAKNYDGFDSFRGSLSTLVASDDDLSNMSSYKPPNGSTFGWDYLLNWGPNFESLVGVFKDIAELPDNTNNGRVSNRGTPKPNEEYV